MSQTEIRCFHRRGPVPSGPPRRRKRPCYALASWLHANGVSNSQLARTLGVTANSVSLWINEGRIPKPHTLAAIAVATRGAITAADWETRT